MCVCVCVFNITEAECIVEPKLWESFSMPPFVPQVQFRLTTFPFLTRKILAFIPLLLSVLAIAMAVWNLGFRTWPRNHFRSRESTAPHEVPSRFSCSGTTGKQPQVEVMWEVSGTTSVAVGQFSTQKNCFVIENQLQTISSP